MYKYNTRTLQTPDRLDRNDSHHKVETSSPPYSRLLTYYHLCNIYVEWRSKYHASQLSFFYDSHQGKDKIGNLSQELTNQMWQLMW